MKHYVVSETSLADVGFSIYNIVGPGVNVWVNDPKRIAEMLEAAYLAGVEDGRIITI